MATNEFEQYHGRQVLVMVKPTFKKFGLFKEETDNFITLIFDNGDPETINKSEIVKIKFDTNRRYP